MTLCVATNFDMLLTIDKNLRFQQNLDKYPVILVVLNSYTSKLEELITFLPAFKAQLSLFEPHNAYLTDSGANL